jgi:hypothetical protein
MHACCACIKHSMTEVKEPGQLATLFAAPHAAVSATFSSQQKSKSLGSWQRCPVRAGTSPVWGANDRLIGQKQKQKPARPRLLVFKRKQDHQHYHMLLCRPPSALDRSQGAWAAGNAVCCTTCCSLNYDLPSVSAHVVLCSLALARATK